MGDEVPLPKILIADDNQSGVVLLEAYLSEFECETKVTSNGEETLNTINQWLPDIVLLDVMMPKLSGFDVCKAVRNRPETKDVGIIMVTALDEHSDIDKGIDAGTDDFLTKPIDQQELLIRIESLLKARNEKDDLSRTLTYIRNIEAGLNPSF